MSATTTSVLPVAIAAIGRLRAPWRFFFLRTATSTAILLSIPLLRAFGVSAPVAIGAAMLALFAVSRTVLAAKTPRHLSVRNADDGSLRAHGKFRERTIERHAQARILDVRRREDGGLGLSLEGIDIEVGLEPSDIPAPRLEGLARIIDAAMRGDEAAMRAASTDSGLTLRRHNGHTVCIVYERPGMLSVSLAALAVACVLVIIGAHVLRANFG